MALAQGGENMASRVQSLLDAAAQSPSSQSLNVANSTVMPQLSEPLRDENSVENTEQNQPDPQLDSPFLV